MKLHKRPRYIDYDVYLDDILIGLMFNRPSEPWVARVPGGNITHQAKTPEEAMEWLKEQYESTL